MFEYLKGKIEYKKPDYAAVDINGVGYKAYISLKTYDKLKVGEETKLFIYNHVKEDAFKLIGFLNEGDRAMFEMLLSVSGIGVSLALAILSNFDVSEIKDILLSEDFKTLKRVPKLGEKKSKQIILDLKSKMGAIEVISCELSQGVYEVNPQQKVTEELYLALDSLGYSRKDIDALVTRQELMELKDIESAIKFVLKKINGKK